MADVRQAQRPVRCIAVVSVVVWFLLFSMAALPAQRTWTVDLLNRPGTDFLDLPAAVAAVAPGDVLRVRWIDPTLGQYYLLPTISRALTILGEGVGPTCFGILSVVGLPQGEQVVITRLRIGTQEMVAYNPPLSGLLIHDCHGPVVINDCECGRTPGIAAGYLFERCMLVWLRNGTFHQSMIDDVTFHDSLVIAEGTSFIPDTYQQGVVIYSVRSDIWLVDSTVQGARQSWPFLPMGGLAIASCNSTFHLAGNSRVHAGNPALRPAIGNGCPSFITNVFLDPRAQVDTVDGTVTNTPIPAQIFTMDTLRTNLSTTTYGHANGLVLQAWALAPTGPFASPIGFLCLDPLACFVVDFGLLDNSGLRVRNYPIPPGLPPQMMLALQTIEMTPSGTLQLANVSLPNLW